MCTTSRSARCCRKTSSTTELLAADDPRAGAGGFLVDAVARLLVLGHAQLLDAAVGGGVLADHLDRADQAHARLFAGRAAGELPVGDLLEYLEAAVASIATAGSWRVIVQRHACILCWRHGDQTEPHHCQREEQARVGEVLHRALRPAAGEAIRLVLPGRPAFERRDARLLRCGLRGREAALRVPRQRTGVRP